MSFVIDENAIRHILEQRQAGNGYTVTPSNLPAFPSTETLDPLFPMMVISGTTASIDLGPQMSSDTIARLRDLRQRIVESGSPLMTTEELDREISERKKQLSGD